MALVGPTAVWVASGQREARPLLPNPEDFLTSLHYKMRLNEDENASQIAYKVGEQPFCTFKSVIKYKIISSYNNTCIDPENCVSCQRGNIDSVEGI